MLTPYQFASNSPIANIDMDGLEAKWYMYHMPTGQFRESKPIIAGPVTDLTINAHGYFTETQVNQYKDALTQSQKRYTGPTIRPTEYVDGSPHTLQVAKGLVQTAPMILEEVAEVPMLLFYTGKGAITGDYSDAKYQALGVFVVGVNRTLIKSINPSDIRFSQSSINDAVPIIESMKQNGWIGDPINVVRMPDGKLTSIDNTRLLAASEAGIDVQAVVRNFDDPLPKELIERFTTKKGTPKTWGEALELRIKIHHIEVKTRMGLTKSDGMVIR